MNSYEQYTLIQNFIEKISIKDTLLPMFKENMNNDSFYLTLYYKKKTSLNPFNQDICFSISLSEDFPEQEPYVRCLTTFTEPSLFDNRNLLYSIIQHYWSALSSQNNFEPLLQEIVDKIPKFLAKVQENSNTKTLIYFGGYIKDEIYEINDFLMNEEIKMFRIKIYKDGKIQKDSLDNLYLILTDIYYLILEPAPEAMNLGKLIYKGEIQDFNTKKLTCTLENEVIISIVNKNNDKDKLFQFYFVSTAVEYFSAEVDSRISKLTKKYDFFMEDAFKLGDNLIDPTKKLKNNNSCSQDLEPTLKIIDYKESLYASRKTLNLIKELIVLYEKVIEIFSANNDPKYQEYLDKLKTLYKDKDKFEN